MLHQQKVTTRSRTEEPPAGLEERPEKVPKVNKVRLPEPGFTDSEAEGRRANAVIRTLSDDDDPMSTSSTSCEFRARIRRVCRLKSVKDVEKFLKKEYNDDEEVDMEELEGLEAEIDEEEDVFESLRTMIMKKTEKEMRQRGRMIVRKDHQS